MSTSFPAFRRRAVPALAVLASAAAVGGCDSSSGSGVSVPTIGAAKVFTLAGFQPSAPVLPGRSTIVSFTIQTPAGKPLTAYKQCCEPHAGVDLIMVRSDDSHALYEDSDIAADGRITQPVVFPAPGRYRIVVDAYPKQTSPESPVSFQLFTWVTVRGSYRPQPVAPFGATQFADGYRFQIRGDPHLKADQANFLDLHVVDPQGRKAVFAAWRGALAHALFFREGSLDYFHTHVCSPGVSYCRSSFGATRVTGSSTAPGRLTVGVLLPVPGTWRMFLLTYMHGQVLTVSYTLNVT